MASKTVEDIWGEMKAADAAQSAVRPVSGDMSKLLRGLNRKQEAPKRPADGDGRAPVMSSAPPPPPLGAATIAPRIVVTAAPLDCVKSDASAAFVGEGGCEPPARACAPPSLCAWFETAVHAGLLRSAFSVDAFLASVTRDINCISDDSLAVRRRALEFLHATIFGASSVVRWTRGGEPQRGSAHASSQCTHPRYPVQRSQHYLHP